MSSCRLLLEAEIEIIASDELINGYMIKHWNMYSNLINGVRDMYVDFDVGITIVDAIRIAVDLVKNTAHITSLRSLESSGRDIDGLASMIARFFWEYPEMDQDTKRRLGFG